MHCQAEETHLYRFIMSNFTVQGFTGIVTFSPFYLIKIGNYYIKYLYFRMETCLAKLSRHFRTSVSSSLLSSSFHLFHQVISGMIIMSRFFDSGKGVLSASEESHDHLFIVQLPFARLNKYRHFSSFSPAFKRPFYVFSLQGLTFSPDSCDRVYEK